MLSLSNKQKKIRKKKILPNNTPKQYSRLSS